MIAPPRWANEQLTEQRDRAQEIFREERMREPLEDYLEVFDQYQGAVENLLETTIDPSNLDKTALDVLTDPSLLEAFRYLSGPPTRVKEVKISETMRPEFDTGRECQGLWEPDKRRIIIKRSELAKMQSFAATLLHEITNAKSGFTDVSREFETALTEVIGILSTVCLGQQ